MDFGVYLDDGREGILLPKRFVPPNTNVGDELKVFVYHDSENRVIATTQSPKGIVGDVAKLKVVSVTPQGAFFGLGTNERSFCSAIPTADGNAHRRRVPCQNLSR